jgi:hypothetical protein
MATNHMNVSCLYQLRGSISLKINHRPIGWGGNHGTLIKMREKTEVSQNDKTVGTLTYMGFFYIFSPFINRMLHYIV